MKPQGEGQELRDDRRLQARGLRRRRRRCSALCRSTSRRRHLHLRRPPLPPGQAPRHPVRRSTASRAETQLLFSMFSSGRPTKLRCRISYRRCAMRSHSLKCGLVIGFLAVGPAHRGGGVRGRGAGKARDRLHLPEGLRGDLPGRPGRPDPGGQGLAAVRQALRRILPRPRRRRERGLRLLLRDPGSYYAGRGYTGPSRAPTSPSTAATTSGAISSTSSAPSSASASASATCGTPSSSVGTWDERRGRLGHADGRRRRSRPCRSAWASSSPRPSRRSSI